MSVIDLKSSTDLELKEILVQLANLKIRYHFMNYRRLAIFGPPSLVINVHLALLPLDVQLPIGPKQGAFTLHIIKTEPHDDSITEESNHFQVKFGKIGSFQYVPVQILWNDIHSSICKHDQIQQSPLVKLLQKDFSAVNFTTRWCQVDQSQQKCLCFDIDIQHEDALPISSKCETFPVTIYHQCPTAEAFRSEVSLTEFETRREHWNKVIAMQMVPKEGRISHISFEQDKKYSAKRYYDLHSTIVDSMPEYTNIVTIASQPPAWFFSPKELSLPLRECLQEFSYCGNSFMQEIFTMGSGPQNMVLQQHEFAKYRNHSSWIFMFLTLGAEQIFHLKSIHHEKDEWKIRYYDELIIRTFEQSSLFLTLPPGITASHVIDNIEECRIKETFLYAIPEQETHAPNTHLGRMTDQFNHGTTTNDFPNGAGIPCKKDVTQPTSPSLAAVNGSVKYCPPSKTKKTPLPRRQTKTSIREPATKDVPMTPVDEKMPVTTGRCNTPPPHDHGLHQSDVRMAENTTEETFEMYPIQKPPPDMNHNTHLTNRDKYPNLAPNLEHAHHTTSAIPTANNPAMTSALNPNTHKPTNNVGDQADKFGNEETTEGCSRLAPAHHNHHVHQTPAHATDNNTDTPGGTVTTGGCPRLVPCPESHHNNIPADENTLDTPVRKNEDNQGTATPTAKGTLSAVGGRTLLPDQPDHPQVSPLPKIPQGVKNDEQAKSSTAASRSKPPLHNSNIKDLLNRNASGHPADEEDQGGGTDDDVLFIAVTNATSAQPLEDILLNSDLSGNLVKICREIIVGWPNSFAHADNEYMAKLAACYAIQFSSYMCYAITALRVLTHAPWGDDMFYGHIRELILCAIGNGWTWKEQSAAVQGRRISTVEVCAALASYSNLRAFPPGQISALDSAIITVCDDLFPAHVDLLFAAFVVYCSSCNAQGQASVSIFDSTLLIVPESGTIDLAQMLHNRNPRLALDREDVDFAHCNECADSEQLSYDQSTAGLMFVLQIISTKDQLPTLFQAVVLLGQKFDVQNIGSNPTCQSFQVSGLIMVQGRTSHHFCVIEKVDHDKVLLHDITF